MEIAAVSFLFAVPFHYSVRIFSNHKPAAVSEIVAFYKSAREAARQNYMSYQTILDRINGKVKGIYAPDGYAYCKDSDKEITEMIRKIERKNTEECGANFIKAPEVVFEF